MATLYKRGNIWWACIWKNNKPNYFSLKTSNKNEAKKVLELKELEVHGLTLSEILSKWIQYKSIELIPKRKKGELTPYMKMVKYKFGMMMKEFGDIPSSHITDNMLNGWKAIITKQQSETTAGIVLRSIQPVFSYAYRKSLIPHNPFKDVKIPKGKSRKEYFEKHELDEFFKVIDRPLFKKYFQFFLKTGIRPSEAKNLRWSDIHPDYILFNGKEGKREFPRWNIVDEILKELKELQKDFPDNDYFFINEHGQNIAEHGWLAKKFKKYLKKTKLYKKKPDLVLYSFRHTFATLLLKNSENIYEVSKWMGHNSVTTTEKNYSHIVAKRIKEPKIDF